MKIQSTIKRSWMALCIATALGFGGCSDDSDYDFAASEDAAQEEANAAVSRTLAPLFDPAAGIIPQTNNLLFSGSADGTLNIPVADPNSGSGQLLTAVNTLDGFALTAPITADFGGTLDPASVVLGKSVHVLEVTTDPASGAVLGVVGALTAADMLATTNAEGNTLVFLPLKPLKESTSYMVVLTRGLTDASGAFAATPGSYLLAKSSSPLSGATAALEPVRQLVNLQEAAAASQGIAKESIVLSWAFTTQSVTPVLNAVKAQAEAFDHAMSVSPAIGTTKDLDDRLQGKANIHVGTLNVPYYLDAAAPLTSFWQGAGGSFLTRFNPVPVATSVQTIPVMATVPNAGSANGGVTPADGWPVIIFQHGFTRNRADVLAVADTFADAGFVAVSIDLPLHGVTDKSSPLKAENNSFSSSDAERTFDLDLADNATGAPGADTKIDDSGVYWINLNSLLTSRDNDRQGISDLLVARQSLAKISGIELNTDQVGFVGNSLGGIVGTGYLSQEAVVTPGTLAVTGGGLARLIDGSKAYGPLIRSGLAANNVVPGTPEYDTFFAVTQWVLDPADPVVLGAKAAATHPIHMMEVVGVNGVGSDEAVPNRVPGAPLSGTEPLARVMGMQSVTEAVQGVDGIVRFSEGVHGSLLDPSASFATTAEMQTQTATFQATFHATGSALIPIINSTVISTEVP